MMYAVTRREQHKTAHWAGGSTTEVFLWPPGASYAARDFCVRASSATVEDAHTVFTSLPGYHRLLTPLTGAMRLEFEAHGSVALQPGDVAAFDGGWNTTSYGKCVDFGVMLGGGWAGELRAVKTDTVFSCPERGVIGVYACADSVAVSVRDSGGEAHAVTLMRGDFLSVLHGEHPVLAAVETGGQGGIAATVFTAMPTAGV